MSVHQIYNIDSSSAIPKYRQIFNAVVNAIQQGKLKKGDKIPSLNQVCKAFSLSRDTVMVAYNELLSMGIIISAKGKGYYIERTELDFSQNIFLLFDELNVFKEDLYTSFLDNSDQRSVIDIYFHHFNYQVFNELINQASGKYSAYIIMPATFDHSVDVVSQLPAEKVYILDRLKDDLLEYPTIYQDFEQDVYDGMVAGKEHLLKYQKLIMVFPGGKEPEERVIGFNRFCEDFGFESEVIRSVDKRVLQKGEVYLVVSDRDLVQIVKSVSAEHLHLGSDIGLISFNDSMLKEVVAGGITTISTDFTEMGRTLARMVAHRDSSQIRNPSRLILRKSL